MPKERLMIIGPRITGIVFNSDKECYDLGTHIVWA